MKILVTGGAGFIGSHACEALLKRGDEVVCLDNFNNYYLPSRKEKNIAPFLDNPHFMLARGDIRDVNTVEYVFTEHRPERVIHLAAMAGPRPSVSNPLLYEDVNVRGTTVLLDTAVKHGVKGFVLASTSSVYGRSPTPWTEDLPADRPLSPYAATKRAAELMAYTFHTSHGLPIRVVRFFTVYGPKGRPDMTPHLFVDLMRQNKPLVLNDGGHGVFRDWTYVDDIVSGVLAALDSDAQFEIYNLGNANPVELIKFVQTLEQVTGLKADIQSVPLSPAEPPITFADTTKAKRDLNFEPHTTLEQGLQNFWNWYQSETT